MPSATRRGNGATTTTGPVATRRAAPPTTAAAAAAAAAIEEHSRDDDAAVSPPPSPGKKRTSEMFAGGGSGSASASAAASGEAELRRKCARSATTAAIAASRESAMAHPPAPFAASELCAATHVKCVLPGGAAVLRINAHEDVVLHMEPKEDELRDEELVVPLCFTSLVALSPNCARFGFLESDDDDVKPTTVDDLMVRGALLGVVNPSDGVLFAGALGAEHDAADDYLDPDELHDRAGRVWLQRAGLVGLFTVRPAAGGGAPLEFRIECGLGTMSAASIADVYDAWCELVCPGYAEEYDDVIDASERCGLAPAQHIASVARAGTEARAAAAIASRHKRSRADTAASGGAAGAAAPADDGAGKLPAPRGRTRATKESCRAVEVCRSIRTNTTTPAWIPRDVRDDMKYAMMACGGRGRTATPLDWVKVSPMHYDAGELSEDSHHALNEVEALFHLTKMVDSGRSPAFQRLFDFECFTAGTKPFLAMRTEFASVANARDALEMLAFAPDSVFDATLECIVQQVLLALESAQHTHDFTHYDLFADNVLVGRSGRYPVAKANSGYVRPDKTTCYVDEDVLVKSFVTIIDPALAFMRVPPEANIHPRNPASLAMKSERGGGRFGAHSDAKIDTQTFCNSLLDMHYSVSTLDRLPAEPSKVATRAARFFVAHPHLLDGTLTPTELLDLYWPSTSPDSRPLFEMGRAEL